MVRSVLLRAIFALVLATISGCASLPDLTELQTPPAPHLEDGAPPGIVDARAGFRRHFCEAIADRERASERTCDDWLHRIGRELTTPNQTAGATTPLDVILVSGAFSECFGRYELPFGEAAAVLDGRPHSISTIMVSGRSGTEHNAAQIADYLEDSAKPDDMPRVLVGYSKGTADILQFLADFPGAAKTVDAVVSIAGTPYGSPLADRYDAVYRILFSHLPLSRCDEGDRDVVHSLRTDVRRPWMETVVLPDEIQYYSVAAFTTRERIARALVPQWKTLLKESRRNDGQVLARDALLPNSTLLGYLNADHWAATIEVEKELEFLADRRDETPFPHTALLDAILRQLSHDLAETPPNGGLQTAP